jgi:hypothetical protein
VELEESLACKAKGACITVDVARELPGKVLSGWANSARARAVITHLRTVSTDPLFSDGPGIMKVLEEFWGNLFTARPVKGTMMQHALQIKEWKTLYHTITEEEVRVALAKVRPGSAPGPDGLPAEFYRTFPNLISKLTTLMNRVYSRSTPCKSWHTTILQVLPKEGKDATLVANYRPIALMCNDYKLMASILATRLQVEFAAAGFFPTGFLKGRSIYEPILRVAGWATDRETVICLLDFEKAYDRVQHSWLTLCLEAAGLPQAFRAFVAAMLKGASLRILNGPHLSRSLPVTARVRQLKQ